MRDFGKNDFGERLFWSEWQLPLFSFRDRDKQFLGLQKVIWLGNKIL